MLMFKPELPLYHTRSTLRGKISRFCDVSGKIFTGMQNFRMPTMAWKQCGNYIPRCVEREELRGRQNPRTTAWCGVRPPSWQPRWLVESGEKAGSRPTRPTRTEPRHRRHLGEQLHHQTRGRRLPDGPGSRYLSEGTLRSFFVPWSIRHQSFAEATAPIAKCTGIPRSPSSETLKLL